ncbi:MAG: hypothetical protein IJE89_03835 [Bacilli bacterium]|nr:hypothetical protein [Bacilli bacterium]
MKIQQFLEHNYEQFMKEQLVQRKFDDALGIKMDVVDLEIYNYVVFQLFPI